MAQKKSDPPPKPPAAITPEEAVALADAVRRIDKGMAAIVASGLNRNALVVLLHDSTEVGKRDINSVLDGLESLGDCYLEKTKKEK